LGDNLSFEDVSGVLPDSYPANWKDRADQLAVRSIIDGKPEGILWVPFFSCSSITVANDWFGCDKYIMQLKDRAPDGYLWLFKHGFLWEPD